MENKELWIVYEYELGFIGVYEDEDEASLVYEQTKDNLNEDFQINGSIIHGDERVILAKVKKDYHSFDTKEFGLKENDNGIEEKTDTELCCFKEDTYK
ncbi:hypothetical protein [Bacillus altitudinis]|uniref:Phage protein n=1 Tax=Bacillus altitudinis TaxID=293387 RepID=A0ABV1SBR2_BACAB|nr:hypothetical protein [Bacillus altitudinis]NOL32720.1 hypothetical protein [Bacillus altitudinis]